MSELTSLGEDIRYVREKIDRLDEKVDARIDSLTKTVTEHQLSNERRISTIEAKAGLFGVIGGFLGSLGAHFGLRS